MSSKALAVSEIGVSYPDETFGSESRIGNPFTFLLRDILQFDNSIDEAVKRMQTTRRTCNLLLGVGDGNTGTFRGFQVSNSVCNVVDDQNLIPQNETWHPRIENVVYWAMDWKCEAWYLKFKELLTEHHGRITGEVAVRQIVPLLTSGNLQTVVYDLTNMEVYLAYGYRTDDSSLKINAFDRPYLHLDMKKIFSEEAPSV